MKKPIACLVLVLATIAGNTLGSSTDAVTYRCLIQLSNYGGEGAYVITSLVDSSGTYVKTLFVGGDDEEWYPDIPAWHTFYEASGEDIDGITGASIQSGGRKVAVLQIDADKFNSGYKLRFESSVEDGHYYQKDLEVDLSDDLAGKSFNGNGYIRYVRLINP